MDNSLRYALKTFQEAYRTVPAYQKLIKLHNIIPGSIRTEQNFLSLPVIDKNSYITENNYTDLLPKGEFPPMSYASSGSSGKPSFWFHGEEQEIVGGRLHECIFNSIFNIPKTEPTLVIICFSMGIWIAGNYTLSSCRWMARQGYKITAITPGIDTEDILNILKKLAPQFQNLVLAGYPPFITDVLHEAKNRNITLPENTFVITAGDKFQEDWRTRTIEIIGNKKNKCPIINIYGCADATVLGHETPLTVFLRQTALVNKNFNKDFFGDKHIQPALYQYNPKYIYIESVNEELLLTVKNGIPLVRYNIHDAGTTIPFKKLLPILDKHELLASANKLKLLQYEMPLVMVNGRNDVAVTFYALNIYPEHIKAGLEQKKIKNIVTGKFFAYTQSASNYRHQELHIQIEITGGKPGSTKNVAKQIQQAVLQSLMQLNIEYRKLYSTLGSRALPVISVIPQGSGRIGKENKKGLIVLPGKKPKIIL